MHINLTLDTFGTGRWTTDHYKEVLAMELMDIDLKTAANQTAKTHQLGVFPWLDYQSFKAGRQFETIGIYR